MARMTTPSIPKNRSAVTNGSQMFLEPVDGRTNVARRYRDIISEFSALVGGAPTIAQDSLIRRIAALSVSCEQDECRLAAMEEFNQELFIRKANILGGLVARLGLAKAENNGQAAKVIDQHSAAILGAS